MKLNIVLGIVLAALMVCGVGAQAQEEMSKEQWQEEMNKYTQMINDLRAKNQALESGNASMTSQSASLSADYDKCLDELYALVGSNREMADAYRREIESAEGKADDLSRLSDADLMERSGEVDELDAMVKGLWENKLSLVPEFWDRLTALNERIKSLRTTLAGSQKMYTVGTWSRDRDCLWNIAKKRDIYDNAWHWPKIWQGNRDQIQDPDIIHPGQKLKIPAAGGMTSEEKAAARSYYNRKSGG